MRGLAGLAGTVLVLLALCAQPATAEVISINPANESGDPVEQFNDQEAIWAYVKAGFSGGILCVVEAVPGPAPTPTCDHPAMGTRRIVGFSAFQHVPIVAPALIPGDYWIVGDNGDDTTVVSETITVTECEDCPPEFLQSAVAGFKSGMRVIGDTLTVTCALLELYEAGTTIKDSAQLGLTMGATAVAAGRMAAILPAGEALYLDIAVQQQAREILVSFAKKAFFSKEALAQMILKEGVCINGKISSRIADDPPDPDFETVTPPPVLGLPEIAEQPQADALVRTSEASYGHAAALLHAYERFQGAEEAGSDEFARLQAGAVADQGYALLDSLGTQVSDLRAFSSAMETLGDTRFTAPAVTSQANLDRMQAERDDIRVNGFTADETQRMRDAGLTDEQIDVVRDDLGSDRSDTPLNVSAVESMRASADAIEAHLEDVELFARNARVVERRLTPDPGGNKPPVANAGPDLEAFENSSVTFDASGSSDPDGQIASYRWDYGDGTAPETTTGAFIGHSYGQPGTYTAELTVTDDDGATAVDTATVQVANVPPGLSAPAYARAPIGRSRTYRVTLYTGATEPTTVGVDFGDGSAGQTQDTTGGGTLEFTHAYAGAGDYTLTFTATDPSGATSTATGTVTVADAEAHAGPDRASAEGGTVQLGGPSTPPDEFTTVTWDFGDGSDPATGVEQEHVYRNDGEFTATISVTDDKGTVSDTAKVTVTNVAPEADIVAPVSAAVGETVAMRGIARDPGADVHAFAWTFGDGTTGSGKKLEHAFAAAGTYTVGLRVDDGDGGVDTATAQIVVGGQPGLRDSRGRDFWLAFPTNYSEEPTLTLFIAGDTATSGKVQVPGLEFSTSFTVTPGQATSVSIPPAAQLGSSANAQDRGIHVTAGADVSVYGLNRIKFTTDAFLGLPTDALGTQYRVISYDALDAPEAAVVATAEHTTVTITPSVPLEGGHPAGEPFTVALGMGEAYQLRSAEDVTGTLITSNRPVAAFGGHVCANVPRSASYCDHLVEQLTPVETWGRRFVTIPLATRTGGDTFRVLAAQDGTKVKVDGVTVATLDAGRFHERLIDGASVVEADKPVLLVQYSNGTTFDTKVSDPFMVIVPPYEQFQDSYTVSTPSTGFASNFLNLVVPASAAAGVRLDGQPLPPSTFKAIASSGFVGAQVPVEPGSHHVEGPAPFGVTVYGFDEFDSYGYGGGLALAGIATVGHLALTPASEDMLVGRTACVDAKLTTGAGAPVRDVRVDFGVTGKHPGGDFLTTGADGVARYCYRGETVGDDTITASVGALTRTSVKHWRNPAPPPETGGTRSEDPPPDRGEVKGDETGASDLVLACTERLVVLEDVVPVGNRVRLVGVADRRFAGRKVSIVFAPTGKAVASPVVAADGSFSATAPLPPKRLRASNAARYEARIGSNRSLKLKLARRMRITAMSAAGGKVTIAGRVSGPLALRKPDRMVELQRRVGCTRTVFVAKVMPKPNGTFRLTVKAPKGETAAVYRLRTKVRSSPKSKRPVNTFTLPRGIDF